jgi:hypothetical protein
MPLTMRPTGLGAGIDKDRPDYSVYSGEWQIGRIYEVRGGPNSLRWFWSFTVTGPLTRSDRVATLEQAKAQFRKSWDAWKVWRSWKRSVRVPARITGDGCRGKSEDQSRIEVTLALDRMTGVASAHPPYLGGSVNAG